MQDGVIRTRTGAAMKRNNVPIRSRRGRPKLETNSNLEFSNDQNRTTPAWLSFETFEFGSLGIVSDFVLRISDFQLLRK